MAEDQQAPAGEVLADIRTGRMNGAVCFLAAGHMTEERACLGKFCKDAPVQEDFLLISINGHLGLFRSILVVYNKMKITEIFSYAVDEPQMRTALPALVALKRDDKLPCYRILHLTYKKAPGSS